MTRPVVGVGVVARDGDQWLLIRRGRPPRQGMWAFPGGKVDWGESLVAAAIREAKEETGLDVEVGDVVWVGEDITEGHHIVLIDFSAEVVGGTLTPGDDASEVRWVATSDLDALALTPSMRRCLADLVHPAHPDRLPEEP